MVLLKWWLYFCTSLTGLFVLWDIGLIDRLRQADQSQLGLVCIGVYLVAMTVTGYATWCAKRFQTQRLSKYDERARGFLPTLWLTTEALMALGLMGTLIGFLIGGSGFAGLDFSNLAMTQKALGTMMVGITTAITTTLAGLVTSMLLKFQLVNLELLAPER